MPVRRLNHAVLYIRDVATSVAFYTEVLGFKVDVEIPGRAAFLSAKETLNDHDLGLFAIGAAPPGRSPAGSACTTSPGRSAPWASWPRSVVSSPSAAPWSVPPTTSSPSPSTPRTRTATSSR